MTILSSGRLLFGHLGGMFNFLKSTILWKMTYDANFRQCMERLRKFNCKALQEKRRIWREKGPRKQGLSPSEAVFRAIEEFANDYYEANKKGDDPGADFERLAQALNFAAPNMDNKGEYVEPRSFLSERWVEYLPENDKRSTNPG